MYLAIGGWKSSRPVEAQSAGWGTIGRLGYNQRDEAKSAGGAHPTGSGSFGCKSHLFKIFAEGTCEGPAVGRPQDLHSFRGYCRRNDPRLGSPRRNNRSRQSVAELNEAGCAWAELS